MKELQTVKVTYRKIQPIMNTQNKGCMVREGFLEEVAPQKTLALHLFLGQYSVEKRREGS